MNDRSHLKLAKAAPVAPPTPFADAKGVATINGRVLLTDLQAAEALSVARRTFRRMVETGDLPAPVRLSPRCVRWRADDLLRAIERRRA